MSSQYKVRPMLISDVDAVLAIETTAHRLPWGRQTLHDCVVVGYDCRVLVRETSMSSHLVGYIICRRLLHTCHILNLCIANEYQNQGFGKIILSEMLDSLVGSEILEVVLEVRPSNPNAIKLYESFDFQQVEIKEGYYVGAEGIEDALVLKKMIK